MKFKIYTNKGYTYKSSQPRGANKDSKFSKPNR